MLAVFAFGLVVRLSGTAAPDFAADLIAMIFFFFADLLSIVNMLCVNNRISKDRQYKQAQPDGSPYGGISFLYHGANSHSDDTSREKFDGSNSQLLDFDKSSLDTTVWSLSIFCTCL